MGEIPRLAGISSVGVLFAALALAGCSTVPAYRTPDVALPKAWKAAPSEAMSTSVPVDWWTGFRSQQLDELVALGLGDGLDVAIARARLEQARGLAQIAGAGRYPTVDAGLSATHGNAAASGKESSATLQATVNLDLWGGSGARAQSAEMSAQASVFDLDTARQALATNISNTYFDVLALDERITLAVRIADDAQNLLSLVQTQESLGAASVLDIQLQRNTVQSFLAAIPPLKLQREAAFGQLAVLVNKMPEEFALTPQKLLDLGVPDVGAVAPADAVAARPEVHSAEARLKAANFDVGAARAAFLPSVAVTASAGWVLNPTQALWDTTGALLQPLLEGGRLKGQLKVDRAHAQELLAAYRLVILQVLQQTESQMVAVQRLREAEALNRSAVDSASESLRLSRISFEHGASDMLTVITNERTLYQAQDTLLQTRLQRLQAAAGLYLAIGGKVLLPQSEAAAVPPAPTSIPGVSS